MKNHWLFWGFWVLVNALASFIWGSMLLRPIPSAFAGMLLGIAIFILIYGSLDAYLLKRGYTQLHNALRRSVFIKAGLQFMNLFLIFGWPIAPELWAGIISVGITNDHLGISQNLYPFLFALLNTIFTGAILSLLVAVLTAVIFAIRVELRKNNLTRN
ncbi:hypothetical protein [Psychrobacter phenylpyruvicus]|uniref:Uncharacterized protein n=1 Tax=Psychrobacter phenylpyruvicus TaxID=29432 RepID=A0A379LNI7_9GAMM|nr:hypothetical protein [Psychrobacter phenylpyruvicus]SUD92118.1 Uncharacterised protein [Psychrobacter phenylpyruvicus]